MQIMQIPTSDRSFDLRQTEQSRNVQKLQCGNGAASMRRLSSVRFPGRLIRRCDRNRLRDASDETLRPNAESQAPI
jgi:hypothetical protein